MRILAFKEGHDGTIAVVDGGRLVCSIEAEKDSFQRCTTLTADAIVRAAQLTDGVPDVVAIGGWTKGKYSSDPPSMSGYFGQRSFRSAVRLFGKRVELFSSTHELSHVWGAYGMAPAHFQAPCHALVWEGNIGNFYRIDPGLTVRDLGRVLTDPGNKYTFLFSLADIGSPSIRGFWDTSHPGKLMALAAYGVAGAMDDDERAIADAILGRSAIMTTTDKDDLSWSPFHNIGVQSQRFRTLARRFTDEIYSLFERFARKHLEPGLPLVIAGGCGLNCEWNSRWRDSGIFSDVFVPPCCNDSGCAVGTAVDAQRHYTGEAKILWDAYAGEEFINDVDPTTRGYAARKFEPHEIAELLGRGSIVAWVEGRYEIGPRALGHRSLLASPHSRDSRDRLNGIKAREPYRPVAPVCLEEDAQLHFSPATSSPHMLYFHEVLNPRLGAITHVDGSARVQTVGPSYPGDLPELLRAARAVSGDAVLCNTSLNFHGRGFINRMSDLVEYCDTRGIDLMVVNGVVYTQNQGEL